MGTHPRHLTSRALLATLVLLAALFTYTTAGAQQSDTSFAEEPQVAFDSLWVQTKSGRLVVNYEVSDKDWKRLQRADVSLWVTLYFPNESTPPALEPTYSVKMDERTGEAKFPRWLRPPDGDEVLMCISGAGPGDNLGLRRGFLCNDLLSREVRGSQRSPKGTGTTVQMTYRPGIQPYPLPGTLPDFNPPMPQGMPQLPSPAQ